MELSWEIMYIELTWMGPVGYVLNSTKTVHGAKFDAQVPNQRNWLMVQVMVILIRRPRYKKNLICITRHAIAHNLLLY